MCMQKAILEVCEMAKSDEVVVWSNHYKIQGRFLKDKNKMLKNIVTIIGAYVSAADDDCDCAECISQYNWLNIREDAISAFSVVGESEIYQ